MNFFNAFNHSALLLVTIIIYYAYFLLVVISIYVFMSSYKFILKPDEDPTDFMRRLIIYVIRNLSIATFVIYILIFLIWKYNLCSYFIFNNFSFESYQKSELESVVDKTVKSYGKSKSFEEDEKEGVTVLIMGFYCLTVIIATAHAIYFFKS